MSNAKLLKKIKKKDADMFRKALRRERHLQKLECWMQNADYSNIMISEWNPKVEELPNISAIPNVAYEATSNICGHICYAVKA